MDDPQILKGSILSEEECSKRTNLKFDAYLARGRCGNFYLSFNKVNGLSLVEQIRKDSNVIFSTIILEKYHGV